VTPVTPWKHPKEDSTKNLTFEKYLPEIGQNWYQNVCISNTIPNLHYTLIIYCCKKYDFFNLGGLPQGKSMLI